MSFLRLLTSSQAPSPRNSFCFLLIVAKYTEHKNYYCNQFLSVRFSNMKRIHLVMHPLSPLFPELFLLPELKLCPH